MVQRENASARQFLATPEARDYRVEHQRTPNINHVRLCRSVDAWADAGEGGRLVLTCDWPYGRLIAHGGVQSLAVSKRPDRQHVHCAGRFEEAVSVFKKVIGILGDCLFKPTSSPGTSVARRHNDDDVKLSGKLIERRRPSSNLA